MNIKTLLFFAVFAIFGAYLFLTGVFKAYQSINLVVGGNTVIGRVVDMDHKYISYRSSNTKAHRQRYVKQPIVEFDIDGEKYKTQKVDTDTFRSNQQVEVIYNKNNPLIAMQNSFWHLWVKAILSLVLGSIFLALAYFGFMFYRK